MTRWYVFTDGSIRNNGEPDARGASGVIFYNEETKDKFDNATVYKGVTNTQTEIMAVLYGISLIRDSIINNEDFSQEDEITFFIDNQSVVRSINEYSNRWIKNGFIAYDGNPIKNTKLWKLLISIQRDEVLSNVNFVWIKAHTTKSTMPSDSTRLYYELNNEVDDLVTKAVDKNDYNHDIDLDTMYDFLEANFLKNGEYLYA